jgi:hypothetical protein
LPRRYCREGILSDPSHATPGPLPPPPPSSGHGCLWGCLVAAAIAITAIVGAISYGGWYFYSGFKHNPTLQNVMAVVNGDQVARAVLGDHIEITNLESSSFSDDSKTGNHSSYVAHLKGSKGEGTLSVSVDRTSGTPRITSMELTGPDGHKYDLVAGPAPPGSI